MIECKNQIDTMAGKKVKFYDFMATKAKKKGIRWRDVGTHLPTAPSAPSTKAPKSCCETKCQAKSIKSNPQMISALD